MKKILVLGRNSRSTRLLISVLVSQGFNVCFMQESRDDKAELLKNRVKKFGVFKTLNQLCFMLFSRLQSRGIKVADRLKSIERSICLNELAEIKPTEIFSNVNCERSIESIYTFSSDCIILSGVRILSSDFLSRIKCPIVNIHAGINPAYRGVHGGYWALVNNQPELFGATVHLVDEGVDTGTVLRHVFVSPTDKDNFSTYPLLQMAAALKVLPSLLVDIEDKQKSSFVPNLPSAIWTHPTLTQYLYNRFKWGIK
jgi:folate-dependent phosphoribosylglycinamide formyltransferase PurN